MKHLLKNILAPIVALFVAIVAMPQAAQAQTNEAYVVENGSTLTFYYDANKATRTGTVYGIKDKSTDNLNMPAWAGTDADNKENITKVVFDNSFRNYKPTSMKYWFYNYTKVNAIVGLSNLKTDNVTSMSYTFYYCSSLTSLNLSSFNTENVDNMAAMFYGCSSLSSLDLSSFNTSKVTNMTYMFSGCPALKMINVSSFNTGNVVDMSAMFYGCPSLSSLDLSSFNTSKVTDMAYMFSRCSSLKMLDVSSFNTENVIDMRNMFKGCALTKLDLSNFNTAKVRFIQSMFAECLNLTTIYCNDDWNTSKVEYSDYMFSGCKSLKGAVAYDASKVTASMANPTTGYFTAIPLEAYVVENGATLTFYYDANKAKRTGTVYDINAKHADNPNMPAWAGTDANKKANITKVVFDNSFKKYNPTSMKYWFSNYTKVNAIEGLSNIKTDKVTSMGYMFYNCSSLTIMDLTSFNTENVVNMAGMFYGCSSLYGVGLSSFNTSKVTDMAYMFSGCSALKMLNVSSFNTENVTDMRYMFFGSSALTKLDLSKFNTAKVSFMQSMFAGCSKLTTIYCKDNWNSNVVSTSDDMFKGCTSLKGAVAYNASKTDVTMANPTTGYFTASPLEAYVVENGSTLTFYYDTYKVMQTGTVYGINDKLTGSKTIPAWAGGDKNINTRITKVVFDDSFKDYKPTSTAYWFYNCRTLETIEGIKNFSTNKVTTMLSMFENCYALKSFDLTRFDTSKVTNMGFMFCFCSSLSSLDLSNFDTSKVSDVDYMFYNCSNLTTIYCNDDWNTSTVAFSDYMFYGCTSLKGAVAFDSSKTDVTMANPTTGYFTASPLVAYVVEDGATLTFYYDTEKATRTGTVYGIDDLIEGTSYPAWAGWTIENNDRITKAVFDNSFKDYKPTSTQEWFNCCTKLESVEGIENLNTENVTNMSSMFCGCSSLKSLDLSSLNTSNVLYLDNMFNDCSALQSINLTNINTEKVTTLNGMFFGCSSLTTLDLSTFNTANVTDLSWTFCSCNSLRTIYCNDDWNTSTVQYGGSMFDGCVSLKGAVEYDSSKVDASMANPTTGYFTKKDGGVESLESEAVPAARRGIYNLQGIKMQGSFDQLPAGFYIVNGKKVFKK